MAMAARRTTAATPAPAQPARRPTRASIAAATRVRVPPTKVVQAPVGPVIKLTNAVAAKDPRFTKTMEKLQKSAAKTKEHAPAARKAAEVQAASVPPANEKLAGAKAQQVDAMEEAETKKPESNSFIAMLRAEIDKVMPKTLGETDEFMKGGKKQQLKSAAASNVNQQKNEAAGGIKAASSAPPDPSKVEGKEVTPLPPTEAPAPAPAVGAAEAMPAPKSDTEVSLQKSKQEANNELTQANVTPEQLRKANDPRFSAVLTAKSAVDKQADSAPQKYRVGEQQTLTQAAAKAVTDEKQGLTALQGQKGKAGVAVKLRQVSAKEKDEAARKKVTDDIEKIYNETKQTVETKLASLETDVSTLFDQSIDAAMQHMTAYIDDRMFQWKLKRYLSIPIIGLGLWIKDKLLGLPAEVNAFYEEGRKFFVNELDAAIVRIAGVVEARLKEAKDEITKGQQRISDYVKNLAPELQAFGKAAEKDMASRFDELRQSVDDKKNDLAQKLAQRYKDAYDKAGEKLKEMQAENKGLISALKEKLGEILKVLREFKERILGLLKKSQDTINLIVADPIGFLKNLLNAIKKGISQFVDNIWTHLKAGFLAWLFGSLAEAGIVVPQDFSLPSILKLVLQVLGLTYDRIRAKAVKLIGERNVMLLEKAWELISALITGGPAALWEKIKEFLGNLKEMIISAIQDWVVTAVIKAAVTKLISMFNPVGAIIQAILAIYNTVMFFIERINQILALVEAIINSVYKIATGDIGSAANWIEQALARTIPVIISFLARLLGLSGITEKIKGFILKIQNTVDKAIDKVIDKIVKGIGKLFGKGKQEKPDDRTPEQKQKDLDKAVDEADSLLKDDNITPDAVRKKLPGIKSKYRLTTLELVTDGESDIEETDYIHGEINPEKKGPKEKKPKPRMKQFVVDPFECDPEYDIKEYRSQIAMQEKGINNLRVVEWLNNRYTYLAEGRSPEGKLEIERLRRQLPQKKTEGKAGLHRIDQVAGGSATDIARFGDIRINSSIGSQWKTRVVPLHLAVQEIIEKVSVQKAAKIYMNVKLSVVRR